MIFRDYCEHIFDFRNRPPTQRVGQYAMNYLYEVYPELYMMVVGSNNDPFYLDSRMSEFLCFIWANWEGCRC